MSQLLTTLSQSRQLRTFINSFIHHTLYQSPMWRIHTRKDTTLGRNYVKQSHNRINFEDTILLSELCHSNLTLNINKGNLSNNSQPLRISVPYTLQLSVTLIKLLNSAYLKSKSLLIMKIGIISKRQFYSLENYHRFKRNRKGIK